MARDRSALHGIDRDPRPGPSRGRRVRPRLPVPLYLRCAGQAMGFQRPMHLGCRDGTLACPGSTQRRDGCALPGKLQQIPGPRMTTALQTRVWAALSEINDPEMPVNLVDLGLIYGIDVIGGAVR